MPAPSPALSLPPGRVGPPRPPVMRAEAVDSCWQVLPGGLRAPGAAGGSVVREAGLGGPSVGMRTAGRPTSGRPLADPPTPRRSLARSQERLPAGSWTGWSEARGARREEAQTMGPCSRSSGPGPEPRATRRLPARPQRPPGPGPSREPRCPHAAPGNRSQPGQHALPPLPVQRAGARGLGLGCRGRVAV